MIMENQTPKHNGKRKISENFLIVEFPKYLENLKSPVIENNCENTSYSGKQSSNGKR